MTISIVIPAYNEEMCIKGSIEEILNYCKKNFRKFELIIVDDGSKDKTYEIISQFKNSNIKILKNGINSGKGFSVKRGIKEAKYSLVLFTDADLATPIEELKKFIPCINQGYDIVIASRNFNGKNLNRLLHRKLMGKLFSLLVNIFILKKINDTQLGFKLFKKKVAKKLFNMQTIDGYCFDVELLILAQKFSFRIKEVNVVWVDKHNSKLNPFKDGLMMLFELLKIKYNLLTNKYILK